MGLANLLATTVKVVTYGGRPVYSNALGSNSLLFLTEEKADQYVENGTTFAEVPFNQYVIQPLTAIKYDDGSAISLDDCVNIEQVPGDQTFYFVLEPAFVRA